MRADHRRAPDAVQTRGLPPSTAGSTVAPMADYTLRAAHQKDGSYRVAVSPAHPDVSSEQRYTREEVERLAAEIDAELRWIARPSGTRRVQETIELAGDANTDPWGGALPTDPAG